MRNTGPASLDAFVERECDCSSTGAPRAARRRCNCRRPERGTLAARHGRTCTRSPCRGCPCCGDALDGSPCLRYRPCQAAGKGSAYAACCAHDSSCVQIRIRTQSACPMLIRTVRHTVGSYDIMLYIDNTYAKRTTCSLTTWRWSYGCQQHAALDYTERICIN